VCILHQCKKIRAQKGLASRDAQLQTGQIEILLYFIENFHIFPERKLFLPSVGAAASAVKTFQITATGQFEEKLSQFRLPLKLPAMLRKLIQLFFLQTAYKFRGNLFCIHSSLLSSGGP
jgi:hypothetical protein